ncbi:AraC-like DNA-binding protein [Catenuloplanes nepalensis]|uniref:AraC-like DNA-binding protein n=1 Tax=Catenuloplanes nepalensis TaxID=587533 RepID=A0ABT9MN32_9ACTN|nr:helix-turn-helix transcriptional regulator [Catenuloplanes nepalensis]MDP9792847.1 AraC-like DNA-binding protein [Catenuloplanes nepalensis]
MTVTDGRAESPMVSRAALDASVRLRATALDDAAIHRIRSGPAADGGTAGCYQRLDERVVLHVVRQGRWSINRPGRRGDAVTATSGRFVARYDDRALEFGAGPRTDTTVLILPAGSLHGLLRDGGVCGSAGSPPLRMLTAHLRTVAGLAGDLPPASVAAARDATVELVRGILTDTVDGGEPLLAPALVVAARRVTEELLAGPELSPRTVADRLHVSVRTLHRAFADRGETLMGHVRQRRLDRALADLAGAGLTVGEAAARWGFTDSSHLIRACRGRYGQTPTQYVRALSERG